MPAAQSRKRDTKEDLLKQRSFVEEAVCELYKEIEVQKFLLTSLEEKNEELSRKIDSSSKSGAIDDALHVVSFNLEQSIRQNISRLEKKIESQQEQLITSLSLLNKKSDNDFNAYDDFDLKMAELRDLILSRKSVGNSTALYVIGGAVIFLQLISLIFSV